MEDNPIQRISAAEKLSRFLSRWGDFKAEISTTGDEPSQFLPASSTRCIGLSSINEICPRKSNVCLLILAIHMKLFVIILIIDRLFQNHEF